MSEDTEHERRMRQPSTEEQLQQLYRLLAGDVSGKPGLIQVVAEHEKLLNDREEGLVPRTKKMESRFGYGMAWIGGASFVTGIVVWLLERIGK